MMTSDCSWFFRVNINSANPHNPHPMASANNNSGKDQAMKDHDSNTDDSDDSDAEELGRARLLEFTVWLSLRRARDELAAIEKKIKDKRKKKAAKEANNMPKPLTKEDKKDGDAGGRPYAILILR